MTSQRFKKGVKEFQGSEVKIKVVGGMILVYKKCSPSLPQKSKRGAVVHRLDIFKDV